MRSNKRYTNATFTKLVYHEEGHMSSKHPPEPAICTECHAIYSKEHWMLGELVTVNSTFPDNELRKTLCPACWQIKHGEPAGFLFVDGDFFVKHKDEMERHLANENAETAESNPLARIMEWKRANDHLEVTTTTEHLAQQLGKSLNRAFGGRVRYDFSHENKLARVYWHRDQ